jgi:putative polyketide hydroxylase
MPARQAGTDAPPMTNPQAPHVPVLVVGGGPAGLMTSLLLARHGVRSRLVERHPGTSILPRATSVNVRTMEILRVLGLAEEVKAAGVNVDGLPLIVEMETLDGPILNWVANRNGGDPEAPASPSPEQYAFCAQDVLEPLLLEKLRHSDLCEVTFGTELASFAQNGFGVTAELLDRSGTRQLISADYLVAADGANSQVRQALAIATSGHDHLSTEINVLFEADLSKALAGRRAIIYRLYNRWLEGKITFRNNDGRNRWTLIALRFDDPSPSRCAELVRRCAGDPTLPVDVLTVGTWERAAVLADSFRDGRVFLTGDAAHRVTPTGGMGMNLAIQSTHNIAWKLAAVLQGWAGPALLDTYELERRPIAARTVELSYHLNSNSREVGSMLGQILGTAFDAGGLIPDGTTPPEVADPVADYVPCARPGHRAPHHCLDIDGRRQSTIDLFDGRFVLLSAGERWRAAACELGLEMSVPMGAYAITDTGWAHLYGVGPDGAVLVRPDGYVAWRAQEAARDMKGELERVLGRLLARN